MRVAELLSDFTSLRATSDGKSALALVTARPEDKSQTNNNRDGDDPELQRVKDLIELHADVKSSQRGGMEHDLEQTRAMVSALSQHPQR